MAPQRAKFNKLGISTTKPGSLLKKHIPVKTSQWDETIPGFLEADTIAHCGTSVAGMFVYTINTVDIASQWTEQRATWVMDKDRLEDRSMILRDEKGFILAVCAAKQVHPFSRNTMKIDFYCFPEFVENNKDKVTQLIDETLKQIRTSERVTKPCYLSFSGIDETKITIFKDLGFKRTGNEYRYYTHEGRLAYVTEEYSLKL